MPENKHKSKRDILRALRIVFASPDNYCDLEAKAEVVATLVHGLHLLKKYQPLAVGRELKEYAAELFRPIARGSVNVWDEPAGMAYKAAEWMAMGGDFFDQWERDANG